MYIILKYILNKNVNYLLSIILITYELFILIQNDLFLSWHRRLTIFWEV